MPMQALTVVYSRLLSAIPTEVLNVAFRQDGNGPMTSLDERIKEEIIKGRVLPEVNTTCGKEAYIPLLNAYIETSNEVKLRFMGPNLLGDLYRIPPDAREGRDIIVVRGIYHAFSHTHHNGVSPLVIGAMGNNMTNLMEAALTSHTLTNGVTTPQPILREGNIIQISPRLLAEGTVLQCLLGYDEEFTNIPHGSIDSLADYVIAVTKGYIHNKLSIAIDQGQLIAGQPIGQFREFVARYEQEGSLERQREILQVFRGGSVMSPESWKRYLQFAL